MMGKRVAVLQSNYIPWKGYFDIVHDVDLFIFHDDLQYTKQDWRNRNRIKTPKGTEWLTIPVGANEHRLICDIEISETNWAGKHWRIIQQNYSKAPYFARYKPFLEDVYGRRWTNLCELNQFLISKIAGEHLGLVTEFQDSRDYQLSGRKADRLLELLEKSGANLYVSGPAAKDYIEPRRFEEAGIQLVWKNYDGYPEYPQFFPPFVHEVTILDLLFQVGPGAPYYIWGWRTSESAPSVSSS